MLNKAERYKVLEFWKHFSVVGQLPVEVDLANWRLNAPTTKKQYFCIVSYCLYVLHSVYQISGFVYAYFFVPDIQLHQLIIHALLASAAAMCCFWYYKAYIQDHGLFTEHVHVTLVGNVGGTPDLMDGLKTDWTRRLWEYSMQDFIAMSSPYLTMLAVAAISCTFVYDPSMRLLLFAALPAYLQNWGTFGILMLEEVRFLINSIAIVTPMFQMHVISFDLVGSRLVALSQKIEKGRVTARSVYQNLRSLQLYVSMFNELNSYLIFTWKLQSISVCVTGGFAAIAHFSEHAVFGLMYYVLLVDCAFLYTLIYEKAFKIPRLFDETTSRARLHMCWTRRDLFSKQISSIPSAGIIVGHFHKMERTSTLIFINFVVANIVSMLVAFR